jgi:ribosome-binding protein aMBF1 (putative translation factor)
LREEEKDMRQKTPGQHIERTQLQHHWSQEDLATRLESSRQSVHRWEQDKTLPALKMREKLIMVLGVGILCC